MFLPWKWPDFKDDLKVEERMMGVLAKKGGLLTGLGWGLGIPGD